MDRGRCHRVRVVVQTRFLTVLVFCLLVIGLRLRGDAWLLDQFLCEGYREMGREPRVITIEPVSSQDSRTAILRDRRVDVDMVSGSV